MQKSQKKPEKAAKGGLDPLPPKQMLDSNKPLWAEKGLYPVSGLARLCLKSTASDPSRPPGAISREPARSRGLLKRGMEPFSAQASA